MNMCQTSVMPPKAGWERPCAHTVHVTRRYGHWSTGEAGGEGHVHTLYMLPGGTVTDPLERLVVKATCTHYTCYQEVQSLIHWRGWWWRPMCTHHTCYQEVQSLIHGRGWWWRPKLFAYTFIHWFIRKVKFTAKHKQAQIYWKGQYYSSPQVGGQHIHWSIKVVHNSVAHIGGHHTYIHSMIHKRGQNCSLGDVGG